MTRHKQHLFDCGCWVWCSPYIFNDQKSQIHTPDKERWPSASGATLHAKLIGLACPSDACIPPCEYVTYKKAMHDVCTSISIDM